MLLAVNRNAIGTKRANATEHSHKDIEDLTRVLMFHVYSIYLTNWEKAIKGEAFPAFYRFFATSLKNSIIQKYECLDSIYHMTFQLLSNRIFWLENVIVMPSFTRR